MVSRRRAGYTLLEVVVAMAVFGIFLAVLGLLTSEMHRQEKRLPVNFMRHPQVIAVLARLRKDVLDAAVHDPYPERQGEYVQSPETLIVRAYQENGGLQTIVWDFRTPTVVRRIAYNVGVPAEWVARGLPPELDDLQIGSVEFPGRHYGVRLTLRDKKGRIAIDQILQPRAYGSGTAPPGTPPEE